MASPSQPITPVSSGQSKGNDAREPTSASLYVEDLDYSVSESQLEDFFAEVGLVSSVTVCRDNKTKESLGYAFVKYTSSEDATKAMESLNFKPLNGKPIRIMLSNQFPIKKTLGKLLFVKNLASTVDSETLREVFATFGTIVSSKLVTDCNGHSKGYGYVQFDKDEAAQSAYDGLEGMALDNKILSIVPFKSKEERDEDRMRSRRFPTLFVKNLPIALSDDGLLHSFFAKFGELYDVVIVTNKIGYCRFAFVVFMNAKDAAAAIEELNGFSYMGKVWYVGWAGGKYQRKAELMPKFEHERRSRFETLQGANLYLRNLDDRFTDEMLKDIFSEFGTVTSCKVMRDSQWNSRGFGFVAFSTPEDATKAVNGMNGKMIGQKRLYVAVAQSKEERKTRLQANFGQQTQAPVKLPATFSMHWPMGPWLSPQQLYFVQGSPHSVPTYPAAVDGFHQQLLPGEGVLQNHLQVRGGSPQEMGASPQQMRSDQLMQCSANQGFRNVSNEMGASIGLGRVMGPLMPWPFHAADVPVA